MTDFADLSELINRCSGGNNGNPRRWTLGKDPRVNGAAAAAPVIGRWTSLWRYEGQQPHGAAVGAVAAPDNNTNGAIKLVDATGGRALKMPMVAAAVNAPGVLRIYDRLLHVGGLSGTNTGAQTIGGTLTRNTGGEGNEIWLEIQSLIGTTATTAVINYTNQAAGASASPAFAIGGTGLREAERMIPVPLAAGDTGVQGGTDLDLVASTGTVGDIAVVIMKPLIDITIGVAGGAQLRSYMEGEFPELPAGACLAMMWFAQAVTLPQVNGSLLTVER